MKHYRGRQKDRGSKKRLVPSKRVKRQKVVILVVALGAFSILVWAFWLELRGPAFPPADSRYVCMVEDQVLEHPTLPVQVAGATYHACGRHTNLISRDAAYRITVDPLTGENVDKSAAALRQDRDDKKVYYFENEENAKEYMHIRLYGTAEPHRKQNR